MSQAPNPFVPGTVVSHEFLRWVEQRREAGHPFATFEVGGNQYLTPLSHDLIAEILRSSAVFVTDQDPRVKLATELDGADGEMLGRLLGPLPFHKTANSPEHHRLRRQFAHPVAGCSHFSERIKAMVRRELQTAPLSSPFNLSHFNRLLCLKIGLDIFGLVEGVNAESLLPVVMALAGVASFGTKEEIQAVARGAVALTNEFARLLESNPSCVFQNYKLSEKERVSFASFYFLLLVYDPSDLLDRAIEALSVLSVEAREEIRSDRKLLKGFVSEVSRYYPVVGYIIRFAERTTTLSAGTTVPEGTWLLLIPSISAFDKHAYPDPYAFNYRREPTSPRVLFGNPGAHNCVGMEYSKELVATSVQVILDEGFTFSFTGTRQQKDNSFFVGTEILEAVMIKTPGSQGM
jgi:cytochrome P450